jgi:hypothetical protein
MSTKALFTTATPKRYAGQRVLHIAVRTVHLGAVAMVLGSIAWGDHPAEWIALLVVSGGALVADDLYRYRASYFRYAQSWAILLKLALLVPAIFWSDLMIPGLWAALVVGSVISHAPGAVRHFALWGEPGPCARRGSRGEFTT